MAGPQQSFPQSSDLLLRSIVGIGIALGVLYATLRLIAGSGPVIGELTWYAPMIVAFLAMAALSIAFLAFGRYRVRREPTPFWIGMAFISYAILAVFYILAFPGLLPDGRSFIALLPNTSLWIVIPMFSLMFVFLLAATIVPWPSPRMPGGRWSFWLVAATLIVVVAIASLLLMFERNLPELVVDGFYTPLFVFWQFTFVAVFGVGVILSASRYRQTGNFLLGYVALAQEGLLFYWLAFIMGERRYDFWWYLTGIMVVSGFSAMLFGLLSEYVRLYRRERDRTIELQVLREDAQRRAAELQGILDNMVDAVYVSDLEGRITLANEAGLRLLGIASFKEVPLDLAELPARVRLRRSDGTPVEPERTVLMRALAGETVVQEDEIVYNPQIKRDIFVRSSAAPIRDERGNTVGAVAVTKDVTELTELDRLKDQFMSAAAHELKTPVTGIKGYAQLLLRREHEGVSPAGLKALEAINRQSDRISRLVNELLDISRIQTGRLELHVAKFDLTELADQTLARMRLTTEEHRLLLQSPGPVPVVADRERIEEVLSTLLDNAIKFSPQGGDIVAAVYVTDGEAVVSIRDHGIGIPRDKQNRIFEQFYRAHIGTPYDYGGMGVGLFISKEIIERHGGKIWFESEEGKGSTFYLSLPLGTQ